MPQTRRIAAQTVCHFSHNADFDQLRISKYPANAHEINYFSMLVVGSFKYTLSESGKSPAEQLFGVESRSHVAVRVCRFDHADGCYQIV